MPAIALGRRRLRLAGRGDILTRAAGAETSSRTIGDQGEAILLKVAQFGRVQRRVLELFHADSLKSLGPCEVAGLLEFVMRHPRAQSRSRVYGSSAGIIGSAAGRAASQRDGAATGAIGPRGQRYAGGSRREVQ